MAAVPSHLSKQYKSMEAFRTFWNVFRYILHVFAERVCWQWRQRLWWRWWAAADMESFSYLCFSTMSKRRPQMVRAPNWPRPSLTSRLPTHRPTIQPLACPTIVHLSALRALSNPELSQARRLTGTTRHSQYHDCSRSQSQDQSHIHIILIPYSLSPSYPSYPSYPDTLFSFQIA